jgi:hypothetical protein
VGIDGRRVTDGTPYRGALERLIRIHRESKSNVVREQALYHMLGTVDRARAIAYTREVAMSADPTAFIAIQNLMRAMAPSGQGDAAIVLRELWERRLVTEPLAARSLQELAKFRGWPAPR